MKTPNLLLSLGSGLLLSLSAPLFASDVPDSVTIDSFNAIGSGCRSGTFKANVAQDRKSFSILFSDYIAEIGPGFALADSRNSCQLTINLTTPPGWRFAIASFVHRGFFDLQAGIQAQHSTLYYFQGRTLDGHFQETIQGPGRNSFTFEHKVPLPEALWSNCDDKRALNIKSAIRLDKPKPDVFPFASGVIGTDAIDGFLHSQEWRLLWAKCS